LPALTGIIHRRERRERREIPKMRIECRITKKP
jgi:hypothetical protein